MSDVLSETHLVWRNIVSARQSVWAYKKLSYSGLRQPLEFSGNEQMQTVFTAQEFLEVAIESWSECNYLNFLDIQISFTVKEPLILLYLVIK